MVPSRLATAHRDGIEAQKIGHPDRKPKWKIVSARSSEYLPPFALELDALQFQLSALVYRKCDL
jgi:hypothetical protein